MKTLRNLLTAVAIMMGTLTMNAQSMSITAIRSNARFLTDRMAYTLGISDPFLIDEIYRINYDYIYGVNTYLDDIALGYYYDDYMLVCDARDIALRNLLGITVWNRLIGYSYFHRPIIFSNHRWHFGVYDYDRFGATHFHYAAPRPFGNGYAGGHFFGGMAPRGGRGNATPPPPPPGGGMNNGRGNAGAPSAPQGGMNNGRGNANTPSAPQGGMNNGRGNASTPSAPQGGMNNGKGNGNHSGNATAPSNSGHSSRGSYTGSRSQSNMQSSSRASSTRTSTGRSNSGSVSRGGGSGASRGGSGGGARGGGRR